LSDADLVAVAGGVILTAGAVALQLVVGRDVFRSRGAASALDATVVRRISLVGKQAIVHACVRRDATWR